MAEVATGQELLYLPSSGSETSISLLLKLVPSQCIKAHIPKGYSPELSVRSWLGPAALDIPVELWSAERVQQASSTHLES